MSRGDDWSHYAGLCDGLHILVARGAADSFEELVGSLASAQRPHQFLARLRSICNRLPLPEAMPPSRIGLARRLGCVGEIQVLASRWQNCLPDYICSINNGWRAIYLWEDQLTPAVCSVSRHGRLGWFVDDVKGPHTPRSKRQS
jgi:hypothetical protein